MRRLHTSVASALSRIKAVNGDLNAVVHAIDPPSSSTAAGVEVGPGSPLLASLPILVKDSIDVAGMPTVCGLPGRQGSDPAPADAPLIARLRRAGAEIIGKTNVPAGCLDMQTFNKVHGRTNNPYDPQRTPGGSSGGSAAAVAAGMVELAIGSDLAGSLRVPASFCGVSSVKPTARRLSPRGHVPPAACMQNNLTLGALARDVRTLERFMQAACAPNTGEEDAWEDVLPERPFQPLPELHPRDVRVVLTTELKGVPTDARIVEAMTRFGAVLDAAGVEVHHSQGPAFDSRSLFRAHKLFSELCGSSNISGRGSSAVQAAKNPLSPSGPEDTSPKASQLYAAEQIRDVARALLRRTLSVPSSSPSASRRFQVWVLPVAPVIAFEHNDRHKALTINGEAHNYWTSLLAYAYQAAATGAPVVTLPIGMIDHLPVGVQVMGKLWEDEELLAVARCLQDLLPPLPPPPIFAC
eukprot:Tamp_15610.p1 GENE.Tamp_15610~~Tamp_15610.p1  ORF type:complete len:467 (-),score=74.27 Tamp_15610:89-1489(-)